MDDPFNFYIGEQVDNILSFRLSRNEEIVGLITCSQSKGVVSFWEWDVCDTKLPLLIDTFQLSPISCMQMVSINLDATRFLIAEKDHGFTLFQVSKGKIQKLEGPVATGQGNVLSFDISRNGTHFLAAGEDGFLRFYSTSNLSLIRSIRASASSLHVARFATDTLIFCASSNKVEVWDLQKSIAEPILYLEAKQQDFNLNENNSVFIWDICVHPDQPFICAAVDNEGNFSLWDLRKNKLAHQLFTSSSARDWKTDARQYPLFSQKIHKGNILKSSFVVDHPTFIVTCGEDGSLLLIDLEPLDLNPSIIEKLRSEKILNLRHLFQRYSSISDFCVVGNVIFTANEDESISKKTLDF